jgi:hypothetical protein
MEYPAALKPATELHQARLFEERATIASYIGAKPLQNIYEDLAAASKQKAELLTQLEHNPVIQALWDEEFADKLVDRLPGEPFPWPRPIIHK